MSVQLQIDLPEDFSSIVRGRPEAFAKELLMAAAVKWYEMGRLSQSRAAELAGVSRREFLDSLDAFGVSPFQETPDELERELIG